MMKCIYLKKEKPEVHFNSREHIIPAGIGGICTLDYGVVSDEFNNILSALELDFMRNSVIAIQRQFIGPGKRGSLSINKSSKSNIHIIVKENDSNDASLGYVSNGKQHQITQLRIDGSDAVKVILDYSDENEKTQKGVCDFINAFKAYDKKHISIVNEKLLGNVVLLGYYESKWYLAHSGENTDLDYVYNIASKAISKIDLNNLDTNYESAQAISNLHFEFNMDDYMRVAAKIVFNFLAHSKGASFALDSSFDGIRNWIINGGENNFVRLGDASERSTFYEKYKLPKDGHSIILITMEKKLIGYLCLYGGFYNQMVLLSENYEGNTIVEGFICDWRNRREYTLLEHIKNLGNGLNKNL